MNSTVDLIAVLERAREDNQARGQASLAEAVAVAAARDLMDFACAALPCVVEVVRRQQAELVQQGHPDSHAIAGLVEIGLREALVRVGCDVEAISGNIQRQLYQVQLAGSWRDVSVAEYLGHVGSTKRVVLVLTEQADLRNSTT